MEEEFRIIKPGEIQDNIFKLIAKDYMLITAGTLDAYNTMTANWGTLGYLWNRNIAICFVRQHRYTYEFIEASDVFTLSFFDKSYKKMLDYCGTKSGRDVNKAAECNLTPVTSPFKSVFFNQARLVLECKKVYRQEIKEENMLEKGILDFYPKRDFHTMYIGEIVNCFIKE